MSWPVDSSGYGRRYKQAVTVDSNARADGTAIRATVTLDSKARAFWDNVQSNGYDVLFATADGTLIDHNRGSWTYASETATFSVHYTTETDTTGRQAVIYMYWGGTDLSSDPPGDQTITGDPSVSDTADPQDSTTMEWAMVWPANSSHRVIRGTLFDGNDSTPRPLEVVPMSNGAKEEVILDLSSQLREYDSSVKVGGSVEYEAPVAVNWTIEDADSSGSPTTPANWFDIDDIRCLWRPDRGFGVRVLITPDEAVDALLEIEVITSTGRKLQRHALVRALAPQES